MLRYIGLTVVLLAALGLAGLLAWRGTWKIDSGKPSPGVSDDAEKSAVAVPPPEFRKWADPAAVLVLTGNQHGYLEPCGCSEKQAGGMARRGDLFKQLRAKEWPVVGLDLGGTVERTRKQTQLKFAAITESMRIMDYRGLGLGPEELRLGPIFLLSQHVAPADGSPGLSFLGSNEVFFGTPGMPGGPKQHVILELGGVKIGVAMVLGESEQQGLFPEGGSTDVTLTPPAEAIGNALAEFKATQTEFNVLLSSADVDESRKLSEAFPQFGLVVSGGGPEDPDGIPEKIGDNLLITVGQKGKHAGILAIYPSEKGEPSLKFEMVELSQANFEHDPAMDAVMRDYQQSIKDNLFEVFADMPEGFPEQPGEYVGAQKCGQCHTQAYEKWKTTAHANAYHSLIEGREHFEGTWVPRTHDPECLSCHVTGWNPQKVLPYVSGFLPQEIAAERGDPKQFELLKGQQCENCHGPGSIHSEIMAKWQKDPKSIPRDKFQSARSAMSVALDESLCIKCHDGENSPDFDFQEYWKKIDHSGLRN